jgi:hypothetical protein
VLLLQSHSVTVVLRLTMERVDSMELEWNHRTCDREQNDNDSFHIKSRSNSITLHYTYPINRKEQLKVARYPYDESKIHLQPLFRLSKQYTGDRSKKF